MRLALWAQRRSHVGVSIAAAASLRACCDRFSSGQVERGGAWSTPLVPGLTAGGIDLVKARPRVDHAGPAVSASTVVEAAECAASSRPGSSTWARAEEFAAFLARNLPRHGFRDHRRARRTKAARPG